MVKSWILLFVFVALFTVSIGASYYRYIVAGDFTVYTSEEEVPDPFDVRQYLSL